MSVDAVHPLQGGPLRASVATDAGRVRSSTGPEWLTEPDHDDHDPVMSDLVEYLVIQVPDLNSLSSVGPALTALTADSTIRILDLVAVTTDELGGVHEVGLDAVPGLAGLVRVRTSAPRAAVGPRHPSRRPRPAAAIGRSRARHRGSLGRIARRGSTRGRWPDRRGRADLGAPFRTRARACPGRCEVRDETADVSEPDPPGATARPAVASAVDVPCARLRRASRCSSIRRRRSTPSSN